MHYSVFLNVFCNLNSMTVWVNSTIIRMRIKSLGLALKTVG